MANISKINFKGVEYDIKPLMDSVPTQGSTNAVSSGGVYEALDTLGEELNSTTENFNNFVETGESVIYKGTVSGTRAVIVDVNIPVGTYNLHIDNISSSDTDSDKSMIQYRYESGMLYEVYERGVEIDSAVTFVSPVVKIAFFAARSLNDSNGDSFEYSGVKLYTEPFAKKQDFDDAKQDFDDAKQDFDDAKQDFDDAKGDLIAMQTATASDVGKALKAKTVTDGKVVEWEFGKVGEDDSQESIIEYEPINLLESVVFTQGNLVVSTGSVNNDNSKQTSDYIPIKDTWYIIKDVFLYCIYDENKQYLNKYGTNNNPFRPTSGAYIRVSVDNANIDTVKMYELEHYYPNETEVTKEQPRELNVAGVNFAPKLLNDITHIDNAHFINGKNLFDFNAGYLYVAGTGGVVIDTKTTGDIPTSVSIAMKTYDVHYNNADIPVNGGIASTYYIPVESGKYLFSNYSFWNSAGYDSNKDFLAEVTSKNAFDGYLVPEGMAYVRLNFKAQTADALYYLHSLDDAKNIAVWQEDTAVSTHPPTTYAKQIDGGFVSPNYLDKVVPNMVQSEFLSAMKCLMVREINRREHAWRFGNFNVYVGSGTKDFYLIRKMLMDNGIDFCGFEEMSGRATDLGTFLESWQFAEGFVSPKNEQGKGTNSQSIVSRFPVQTWNTYTMSSVSSNKDCINARIRLPRFLDAYNPFRTLSMYVIHPAIGANQTNLANELLSIIASDESDYIVITSDSNSFSDTEEGKTFWRVLEAGGLRPVIPITTKTVTQDNLSKEDDEYPEKQWRWHSIDQFFVSSNIDCVSYNVINTKDEYVGTMKNNTTTDGEYALSDHDFVYADLVFKDEVRSGLAQVGGG